jgi:hypothetical protein
MDQATAAALWHHRAFEIMLIVAIALCGAVAAEARELSRRVNLRGLAYSGLSPSDRHVSSRASRCRCIYGMGSQWSPSGHQPQMISSQRQPCCVEYRSLYQKKSAPLSWVGHLWRSLVLLDIFVNLAVREPYQLQDEGACVNDKWGIPH